MKYTYIVVALLSLTPSLVSSQDWSDEVCPTWYTRDNSSDLYSDECECGDLLERVVRCETNWTIKLLIRHCMTYNNETQETIAGACPYSSAHDKINKPFVTQPHNVSDLNHFSCGRLHRIGDLCSNCENSRHGVSIFSYRRECVECSKPVKGWWLYFAFATLPVTLFVFLVILCDIRVTAAHMNALVCIVQIQTFSINSSPDVYIDHRFKYLEIAVFTIIGIWNLDFFRYLFPSFCINGYFSTLQVLALDYIIVFYPLLLIAVFFLLVLLHERKCRLIVIIWKPFKKLFLHLRRYCLLNLNAKTSVINAFSTFVVLGYSKSLFTSFTLLSITRPYTKNGTSAGENFTKFVLYNASVPYLSSEHKPYFILAIIMLIFLNILPIIILFLYPVRLLQRMLFCCQNTNCESFKILMDSFQGCYKNRTNNNGWDHRYFAGVYLLIRLVNYIPGIINSLYTNIVLVISPLSASLLFGIIRPYSNDFYNRLDCVYFGLLAFEEFWVVSGTFIAEIPINMLYLLLVIPLFHMLFLLVHRCLMIIAPTRTEQFKEWLKEQIEKRNLWFFPLDEHTRVDREGLEENAEFDDVAHRLQHPNDYRQPLLSGSNPINHGSIDISDSGKERKVLSSMD